MESEQHDKHRRVLDAYKQMQDALGDIQAFHCPACGVAATRTGRIVTIDHRARCAVLEAMGALRCMA